MKNFEDTVYFFKEIYRRIFYQPSLPSANDYIYRQKSLFNSSNSAIKLYNRINLNPNGCSGLLKDKLIKYRFYWLENEEHYYYKGKEKYCSEDYSSAIKYYSKAIELNPAESKYYRWRGTAKGCLKDYIGEIEDLTKAITLEPTNADYYFQRGSIYLIFFDKKASALMDFTCAIKLDNKNTFVYLSKTNLVFEKNFDKAIDVLLDAQKNCETNKDDIFTYLAYIYLCKNEYKKALKYANEAILFNNKNSTAYYNKYYALMGLNRQAEAIKVYEKADALSM